MDARVTCDVAGSTVAVVRGDLTRQDVDAVVNAANTRLQHGGGLAAAIARAGGPSIQEESDAWVAEHGPLTEGVAATTGAGDMPAKMVVHTAGPVYDADSDRNADLLRQAIEAALDAAADAGARSVALPIVSAGVYGYPQPEAAWVIASAVASHLNDNPGRFDEIRLVGYDEAAAGDLADALSRVVEGAG